MIDRERLAWDTLEPVYTIPEIADMLRCSKRTVFNLIRREELACLKIGGLTRVTARQLSGYLNGRRTAAGERPD